MGVVVDRRVWQWQGWPSPGLARTNESVVQLLRVIGLVWVVLQLLASSTSGWSMDQAIRVGAAVSLGTVVLLLNRAISRTETLQQAKKLALTASTIDCALLLGANTAAAVAGQGPPWESLLLLVALGGIRFQLAGAAAGWMLTMAGLVLPAVLSGMPLPTADVLIYRAGLAAVLGLLIGLLSGAQRAAYRDNKTHVAALEDLDQWRTRLLGVLAHDLRSPIATASSLTQTLHDRDGQLESSVRRQLAAQAVAQTQRAGRLLDDLLTMASAEQAQLTLSVERVALEPLIANSIAASGVEATMDVPLDLEACVDPERLDQALYNLLSNARRHGAPPILAVAQTTDGGGVDLAVVDHGPGVEPEDRTTMFDAFEHGGHSESIGLGLWIVREIVHAHHGRIRYRANHPTGARFEIHLPPCGEHHHHDAASP